MLPFARPSSIAGSGGGYLTISRPGQWRKGQPALHRQAGTVGVQTGYCWSGRQAGRQVVYWTDRQCNCSRGGGRLFCESCNCTIAWRVCSSAGNPLSAAGQLQNIDIAFKSLNLGNNGMEQIPRPIYYHRYRFQSSNSYQQCRQQARRKNFLHQDFKLKC